MFILNMHMYILELYIHKCTIYLQNSIVHLGVICGVQCIYFEDVHTCVQYFNIHTCTILHTLEVVYNVFILNMYSTCMQYIGITYMYNMSKIQLHTTVVESVQYRYLVDLW